jgi:hypothetical protein
LNSHKENLGEYGREQGHVVFEEGKEGVQGDERRTEGKGEGRIEAGEVPRVVEGEVVIDEVTIGVSEGDG